MSTLTDHLEMVGIPYCKRCEDMFHLNEDGTTKCPKAYADCDRHTPPKALQDVATEAVDEKPSKPPAKKKAATPEA